MANPQAENGYTKIANEIMERLAKIRIPGTARQVLDCILRKTYGWNKKEDQISLSQFTGMTGLSKVAVCKSINILISMNIITKKGNALTLFTHIGNDIATTYGFNKDFDNWISLPKKVTLPKKEKNVTQKGNITLPILDTTKEIIKETNTKEKNICPHQDILNLWSSILPELIQPQKWDDDDKKLLKMRWMTSKNTQKIEWWESWFKYIRESPFLMGEIEPKNGNQRFKLRLQWALNKTNFKKINDGVYHNG